jgi:hypothetical protein
MGTNYVYEADCWQAYAFDSKKERDEWIEKNEYRDGNRVAEIIDRRTAYKIAGINSKYKVAIIENNGRLQSNWR